MQLIIPMSGLGERFVKAGYTTPKPLIEINDRPMIAYVLDNFPDVKSVLFICNDKHLSTTPMRKILTDLRPDARIVEIEQHKRGPVHAVQQIYDLIDDKQSVMVNYCDFGWDWDFHHFSAKVKSEGVDGCVPAYIGFHPHNLGPSLYAFMRTTGTKVDEIREKHHFTDNKLNEYASSGSYYFGSGAILKHYFDKLVEQDVNINGEYYVSSVYQLMIEDGLNVTTYPLTSFQQWGTPEDLEDYLRWSEVFKKKSSQKEPSSADSDTTGSVNAVVLMAGQGKRFQDEGFMIPKPFIPVSGRPMVEQVVRSLPPLKQAVYVAQKSHVQAFPSQMEALKPTAEQSQIVAIDGLTEGQAITASIGAKALPPDEPLLVVSCDTGMLFDHRRFMALHKDPGCDAVIFAFRNHLPAAWSPTSYGWIEEEDGRLKRVSTKKPISGTPLNDHGVVGTFYFKSAKLFIEAVNTMVERDIRINNEFYIDELMNLFVDMGKNVQVFAIDHYLVWGTPNELKTYQYWQQVLHLSPHHPYRLEIDPDFPA